MHNDEANLRRACDYATNQDHTGEDRPGTSAYPPVAFVTDGQQVDGQYVWVWEPWFSKYIGGGVSAWISELPADNF